MLQVITPTLIVDLEADIFGEVLSLMHRVGHPLSFLSSSLELSGQQRDAVEKTSIFQPLLLDIGKGRKKCGSRKIESKIKYSKVPQKNTHKIGTGHASNPGDTD